MSGAPTPVDTVTAARAMRSELRARAEEIERARRIPADLSTSFARAESGGSRASTVPDVAPMNTHHAEEPSACASVSIVYIASAGGSSSPPYTSGTHIR